MRGIDRARHADVTLAFKLLAVRCREHRVAILRSQRTVDCDIAFRRLCLGERAALDIARHRDIAAGCRQVCRRAVCDIARDRDAAIIGLRRKRGTALDIAVDRDITVSRFGKHRLAACQAAFDRDTALIGLHRDVGAGLHLAFDLHIAARRAGRGIAVIGDELAVNRDSTVAGLSCSVLGRVHLAADHHAAALRLDRGRARLRVDLALDLNVAIFAQGFGVAAFRGEQVALDRDSARLSRLELHAVLGRHQTVDRDWSTESRQRCCRASIDRAALLRRADGDCTVFRRDVNSLVGLQRAVDCNRAIIRRHLDVMRRIDRARHADVALAFKLLAVRCREHRVAVLRSQRAADCDIALRRLRHDRRAALDIARDRDIAASRFGKGCLAACQAAFDGDTALIVGERDTCRSGNRAVDGEVVGAAIRIIADDDILGLAAVGEGDCQVLIAAVAEHDVRRLAGVIQRDVLERIELRIDCEPGTAVKSNARTRLDRSRLCHDGMGRRLVDGTVSLQFQRNSSERAVFQVDFPVT